MSCCAHAHFAETAPAPQPGRVLAERPRLVALEARLGRLLTDAYELTAGAAARRFPGGRGVNHARVLQWVRELHQHERSGVGADALRRSVTPVVAKLASEGMRDCAHEITASARRRPAQFDWPADPQRLSREDAEFFARASAKVVDETVGRIYDQVRELVLQGLDAGLTTDEITAELKQYQTGDNRSNAFTAARNFTTAYYNYGRLRLAEEAGDAVVGYEYVAILDNRTTAICQSFHGQFVAKDELVYVPPLHYGCRSCLYPVMSPAFGGPTGFATTLGDGVRPADGFGANPLLLTFRRAA